MRFFAVAVAALVSAGAVAAAPLTSARVRMVARGELAAAVIGSDGDSRALVTVRSSGGAPALAAAGFDARPLTAELAEVRATAAELARLIGFPGVRTVEERRLLYPTLDLSTAAAGGPRARAETGLDGRGVLVGIVDTGADFRHADLRGADGHTRIAALLDLATPRSARHPEIGDFGAGDLWLATEIDAALDAEAAGLTPPVPVTERDRNGHGTHVSAIAASSGLATGHGLPAGRYVGMAPGAELVVTQATHGGSSFTDGDVLVGCRFALDRAAALGRPLVVNLSLGGIGGPHDGTSNLEVGLDQLFPLDAPGRAIVVAAGNEGNRDLHAGLWRLDGTASLPLHVAKSSSADSRVNLELWYRGDVALTVVSPSGQLFGPIAARGSLRNGTSPEARITIDNASGGPRDDGLSGGGIVIEGPPGAAPAEGDWTVRLDGTAARVDVWVIESPPGAPFARFLDHIDVDGRVSLPATARNLITVGSFITKNGWTDFAGQPVMRPTVVGDISSFSSPGPTADGRFAPDLTAPGEFIAAALSVDAPPDNPASAFFAGANQPPILWADDGVHGLLRGTSQASPHVAGALALLFERDPTLTQRSLRELLRVSATDGGSGYSPRRGFGRLDALAALRYLGGRRGGAVDPTASTVGVSRDALPPGDDTTTITVTPRDAAGAPLGPGRSVAITASAGEPTGPVIDSGWGRYERTFAAHAPRGAVATITVSVDGTPLAAQPSIFFVFDRAEIGRPFTAAGGCSSAGTRPALSLVLAASLIAAALLAWKSRRGRRRSTSQPRTGAQ